MKIYCLKNESVTEAAEYTINYLLNRAGFFFDWITTPEQIQGGGLLLIYQPKHTQANYSLPIVTLSKKFALDALSENDIKWYNITIGDKEIPILIDPDKSDLDSPNLQIISFDLIANVYYHLARLEEIYFHHPDDADKNVENSILFKHGKYMIPVVDILCEFFKDEIEKKAKENNLILVEKSLYPEGQMYGIALTHDVDFIKAFHPIKKVILKLLIHLGIKKNLTIEEIDQLDELTWGFDKLLSFYKQINLKVTFFFMAKYLEGRHFRYRINSKKIIKLLAQIKLDNHEIAFHPSRYAFENPNRYFKEKIKLEKVSGSIISGLRHHYLRCLFPQIWQTAAQLNLKYEAGLVHRHHSGFRAGTCFPFPAFDHKNQKQIDIIEVPTAFFENTLPDKGNDFETSKIVISQLLKTHKRYGGLFNILWHSNNIYQPEVYTKLWDYIIKLIKAEDAYNRPLIEHYNWHKLREQINLKSYKKTGKGFIIHLDIPDGIKKFSLQVAAEFKYKSNSEILHDPAKNILTVNCNYLDKPISIEALAT